jgi:membrane-associated protein
MNWFDAQAIIDSFGDWAAIAISVVLFIETAFVPLSFLPGDSILFLGGLALSNSDSFLPDWSGFLIIWFGAFFGSQVGFWLGKLTGPILFSKDRNFVINRANLDRTHAFFAKYGARAVILARFIPILRAFVPMLAGMSEMSAAKFTRLNLIGATTWVMVFLVPGYLVGGITAVRENLEIAVLVIIVGTLLILPLEILRDKIAAKRRALTK